MVSSDISTIPRDEGKSDKVTITIRDKVEQASPADPESSWSWFYLYLMAMWIFGMLSPALLNRKQSPFEPPCRVFFIITIVAISVSILASASYFFRNYITNVHYVVLKVIGLLSGFLALLSTSCVVFVVTDKKLDNNWGYWFMHVIFMSILILVHDKSFKEPPLDWSVLLVLLFVASVPLSLKLHTIMPNKLFVLIVFAQVATLVPAISKLEKRYKSRTQGTSSSSAVIEQDSKTKTIIHPSVAT